MAEVNALDNDSTFMNMQRYFLNMPKINIRNNYSAVTNVRNPSTTPAKFGTMRI